MGGGGGVSWILCLKLFAGGFQLPGVLIIKLLLQNA